MPELSAQTQSLIQKYQAWYKALEPPKGVANIHVDEVAAKVAAFYEKIRGVIDWREEHLLRRGAIERILKRRLLLRRQDEKNLAAPFVLELIRGGYFPNDKIEEAKIPQIQKLLEKYLYIFDYGQTPSERKGTEKAKIQLYDWLLSLAACEVEEILDPPRRERALIEYMEELMQERIAVPPQVNNEEKQAQISIAVQKALFKLDKAIISYHLLKRRYPDWLNLSPEALQQIGLNVYSIWDAIENDLKHPLAEKFYRICERYDTPYLILGDALYQNPHRPPEEMEKPEGWEDLIKSAYARRLAQLNSRARRAAVYSTISIFATKITLALAIEIPFDKYFTGQFDPRTLILNIIIPPALMFFLIMTIRQPRRSNFNRVVVETMKIIFRSDKVDSYPVKLPRKRGALIGVIINAFYTAISVLSFGLIWWGLETLEFGIISKLIFLVFFSLICFAGVKIRERSKELIVEEEKEGFFSFLLDSFSLPFIRLGKWLSGQWSKYNTVIVLLTALIDMPFQVFTEFLEQWRYFLKEKKEEIH